MADQLDLSAILGKWEMISSTKYDKYLKEAGVSMIHRNIASKAQPIMDYFLSEKDKRKLVQRTTTLFKSFEIQFVPGEEFEEQLADGRKSKSTIYIEGNKLIHKLSTGSADSEVIRVFDGNKMTATFSCNGVVAERVFQKKFE